MKCLLKSRFIRLSLLAAGLSLSALSAAPAAQTRLQQVSSPAPASAAAAAILDRIETQLYKCSDHNVRLHVTYIQTGGGNAYAVMQVEGKQISMSRQPVPAEPAAKDAAAAAKPAAPMQKYYYLSLDPDNSYRWYPEGDKARLTFLSSEGKDKEQTVYGSCLAILK